jgi:hypothetical protein
LELNVAPKFDPSNFTELELRWSCVFEPYIERVFRFDPPRTRLLLLINSCGEFTVEPSCNLMLLSSKREEYFPDKLMTSPKLIAEPSNKLRPKLVHLNSMFVFDNDSVDTPDALF